MHVGKTIPRSQLWPVAFPPAPPGMPPRFLKFTQLTATPVGSVPLQWEDLIVVSAEAINRPSGDPGWFHIFTNPNNGDLTLEIETWLVPGTGSFPTVAEFSLRTQIRFKELSVVLASTIYNQQLPLVWGTASWGGTTIFGDPGVDPAVWTSLAYSLRCAQWADVPAYHPYRH